MKDRTKNEENENEKYKMILNIIEIGVLLLISTWTIELENEKKVLLEFRVEKLNW